MSVVIDDVRAGMVTALQTISGLRASAYVTETINPPMALIDYEANYDLTFGRGAHTFMFKVKVFAQRTGEKQSQVFLDTLRDPTNTAGVKQTLEDNAALAALVDYVAVRRVGFVEPVDIGQAQYLTVEFDVEVVL